MSDPAPKGGDSWDRIWSSSSYGRPGLRTARARVKAEAIAALGLEIATGARVLDLACGSGEMVVGLAARSRARARWVACDGSAVAIRAARSSFHRCGVEAATLRADATALPFRCRSFDVVLACMVLHHLREPERGLSEIDRVIVGDGTLVVIAPSPYSLATLSNLAREAVDLRPYDGRRYTSTQLLDLLRTRFAVDDCRPWQLGFDRPVSAMADRLLNAVFPFWGRYLVARCHKDG